MPLEAGLLSYAAFAGLALGRERNRPAKALPLMPSRRSAQPIGWLLLLLSAIVALNRWGAQQGMVAWIGQSCVAGAWLVLILSWRPHLAFLLAAPALAIAIILGCTS